MRRKALEVDLNDGGMVGEYVKRFHRLLGQFPHYSDPFAVHEDSGCSAGMEHRVACGLERCGHAEARQQPIRNAFRVVEI